MKKVTRTEVGIRDIFGFAEEKFNKGWNACCAIFQGRDEILPFRGVREFYLEEVKDCIGDENYKKQQTAYEILLAFMEENNLETMYYVGNGN